MPGSFIGAARYHDFSAGHRVVGQGGPCEGLHGHNYRVYFEVMADVNKIGMVLDFGIIKELLCDWLEYNWDHQMLLWDQDPLHHIMFPDKAKAQDEDATWRVLGSIVSVPFNPTAEAMAQHLLKVVGPTQLAGMNATLHKVTVWETRKCYGFATLNWQPPISYTLEETMDVRSK
jgi:6-pyruvoyltetrahydropterin/6-carboxytetrahydropterin synthase